MFKKYQGVKKIKKIEGFIILFLCVVLMVYTLYATRYTLIPDAYAGIANTKHNLSSSGGQTIRSTTVEDICVFCHTPHSASKEASIPDSPLWNHSISSATYSVRSLPGGSYSGDFWRVTQAGQPDRGSKLCLGCHDGTVALGLLLNTPGSGTTYPTAVAMTSAYLPCGPSDLSCLGTNFVTGGKHLDIGYGDHLVSMEYNAALATAVQALCPPNGIVSYPIKDPALIPSTNPVKLYKTQHKYPPPDDGGVYNGVQCRSCHDPHEDSSPYKCFLVHVSGINCTGGASGCCSTNPGDNYDALCTTCHQLCP